MNKAPKFTVKKEGRPYIIVHPRRPIKMAANEISSDGVVSLLHKDDGNEGRTHIVRAVSREYDEGAKNPISDMDEAALPLGEGDKKLSREKTMKELTEAFLCEYHSSP